MNLTLTIPEKLGRYTDDELFELCSANSDLRIERNAKQELIFMSPTGFVSSTYNTELLLVIGNWNKKLKKGTVTDSNGGYILPNGAMRAPDVAWISKAKIEAILPEKRKKFLPACPDFVIELRSDTDSMKELKEKMEEWLENGVQLAWLIDPKNKKTLVYQPNKEVETIPFNKQLQGYEVLTALTVCLEEILEL